MKLTEINLNEADKKELVYAEFKSPELFELIVKVAAHRLAAELEDENLETWYQDHGNQARDKINRMLRSAAEEIIEDVTDQLANDVNLDKVFKKLYTKEYNIMTGKHSA